MGERVCSSSGCEAEWKDSFVCTRPITDRGGSCVCSVYAKMSKVPRVEGAYWMQDEGYDGPQCVKTSLA